MIDSRETVFFGIALIVFGGFVGGFGVYQMMQEDIQGLQSDIQSIQNQEQVIYVNDSGVGYESIFNQTESSVVYIDTEESQGSGFVYSENGHIVTNDHVIEGRDTVNVGFTDGETLPAEVVGSDPYTDLAVLKVDRSDLKPLDLANTEDVRVGQTAIAIGNPFGLESSMTTGIISQKGRSIQVEGGFSIRNVVQTDAAINPGNSGGPLMNRDGEVVGVNTAIETQTGVSSGVGFAIPSNTVDRVVEDILEDGEYNHPWIGVRGQDVTPELAEAMELDDTQGFLVLELSEQDDNPAELAGIQPSTETVEIEGEEILVGGDVIVGIEGEEVRGIEDILEFLALRANSGDEITLEVIRDGDRVEVPLTLQDRP